GLDGLLRRRLERAPGDVDLRGGYGTALNAAVWNRSLSAAKVLLEFGADWRIPNAAGLNARQLAVAREFHEFDVLFEAKEA
ncbi:ankyrin repeat domain-containing protein, partial [Pseudomonas sp. FW305-3-2-15-C-LB1]|uniref:ankyrin repeat domain-containing protein n=1 Tax=Pseudomonas sp. FW305-3-2-15-C-LB1 TaxID=2751331 RepID=UPI000CAE1205